MQLLLSQKNQIFDEIENFGLSPSQFSFKSDVYECRVEHISSEYYFQIIEASGFKFSTIDFSPGIEYVSESYECGSWYETLKQFRGWLNNLIRETQVEDKWERLQQEIKSIDIPFREDVSKFSMPEFEILEENINNLKAQIPKIGLTELQNEVIINKLSLLLEQSKTMNKFDWKSLFVGTIISIIMQLSLSHEQGAALWHLVKEVFNHYLLR